MGGKSANFNCGVSRLCCGFDSHLYSAYSNADCVHILMDTP